MTALRADRRPEDRRGVPMTDTATATAPLQFFDRADAGFVESFRRNGFAVLRDALTAEQVDSINGDALKLCRGDLGKIQFRGPSVEAVAAREAAVAEVRDDDEAVLRRYLCIRYPHKASPAALGAMAEPRIVDALTAVIGPHVKAMQ